MLKEVGASGQISLGKKYAGQLFEVETAGDGSIVLRPVKVVPMATPVPTVQEAVASYRVSPMAQQETRAWAEEHAPDVEQYNAWASQREPYAQRVRRWRDSQAAASGKLADGTAMKAPADGAV